MKEILFYNPSTGVFTWRIKRGRVRIGDVAGCLCFQRYRVIGIDNRRFKVSRLVFLYMTGKFPRGEVDHRNHIRDDDRWNNLRDVSHSVNMRNAQWKR